MSPPGACASTRKASHIGADMNHFSPLIAKLSPLGTARVVLVRTSVPPCRSVMPMPSVIALFSHHGLNAGS